MKKNILVPTDFSNNALHAAYYACQLALITDLDIHLFHCYTTQSATTLNDTESLKADVLMAELKAQLEKQYPLLVITTECVSRLLTDVLPDVATEPNFALIVMGTTGEGKGKSLLWGSNTSYITSVSQIPVIAIPNVSSKLSTEKVAILTNFKAEEIETLNNYLKFVSSINQLDIIHIYRSTKKEKEIYEQLQDWSFNIKQLHGINQVNIIAHPVEPNNESLDTIPEVINHIISQNEYDSILVTKTRKSFFKRLVTTSVSREITLHLLKPTFFDKI